MLLAVVRGYGPDLGFAGGDLPAGRRWCSRKSGPARDHADAVAAPAFRPGIPPGPAPVWTAKPGVRDCSRPGLQFSVPVAAAGMRRQPPFVKSS
jgi:hypothetical protein